MVGSLKSKWKIKYGWTVTSYFHVYVITNFIRNNDLSKSLEQTLGTHELEMVKAISQTCIIISNTVHISTKYYSQLPEANNPIWCLYQVKCQHDVAISMIHRQINGKVKYYISQLASFMQLALTTANIPMPVPSSPYSICITYHNLLHSPCGTFPGTFKAI